jgi:hypothetical protein
MDGCLKGFLFIVPSNFGDHFCVPCTQCQPHTTGLPPMVLLCCYWMMRWGETASCHMCIAQKYGEADMHGVNILTSWNWKQMEKRLGWQSWDSEFLGGLWKLSYQTEKSLAFDDSRPSLCNAPSCLLSFLPFLTPFLSLLLPQLKSLSPEQQNTGYWLAFVLGELSDR